MLQLFPSMILFSVSTEISTNGKTRGRLLRPLLEWSWTRKIFARSHAISPMQLRLFNIREGITQDDDTLARRFFEELIGRGEDFGERGFPSTS